MGSQDRAQGWLSEATFDFETARILRDSGRYNASVFYCQQAAEKAVKGLLLIVHLAPWGHSVWNLYVNAAEAIGDYDVGVEDAAKGLDLHYIPTRYPDALPGSATPSEFYDRRKAEEALSWATKILEYVKKHA